MLFFPNWSVESHEEPLVQPMIVDIILEIEVMSIRCRFPAEQELIVVVRKESV